MATLQPVNPADIYAPVGVYHHGVLARGVSQVLHISGTCGIATDGSVPPTLEEQLKLIWANIARILAEAGMGPDNVVKVTSYLTHPSQRVISGQVRQAYLGERKVAATSIVVQLLSDQWFAEIEVVAVA
jgi:enamine deaminase RidA (YjgF/YER057c/UK114 family)